SAKAQDASTVRVTFAKPTSTFLAGLTDFRNSLIPRDFLDLGGKFENSESLVGTGPFVIQTFRNLERAVFTKNPSYWKPSVPYVDTTEWAWITDETTWIASFSKGDVDLFWETSGPPKAIRTSFVNLNPSVQEDRWVCGNTFHLRFNTAKE